ncbi:hypothetical protein NP233_g9775 [Leucocoprinus birnbaumii]|uniref:G-patch domain-containing protein n=1 Tax=Leucocoprinus birnbaumii TaxID=56174 RepID=A0AAD5VJT2_9AGAR|nr:hypothetical protein NP233_g9775 [Leucocoprinus birnbaumii]
MATTSFTIYSRYDPEKDKERLQRETGQIPDADREKDLDNEHLWREAASAQFLKAQRPPPQFVPATISYEVGSGDPDLSKPHTSLQEAPLDSSLSSWYRSLTTAGSAGAAAHQARPSSAPIPTTSGRAVQEKTKGNPKVRIQKDKNNWFIQKVLLSEPPTAPSTPPPTLSDILAREPPPLPSEPKFSPPVWTEIGPSNKGFAMLQKAGWNEGEALGIGVRRRQSLTSTGAGERVAIGKGKARAVTAEETVDRASRIVSREELCDALGDVKNEGVEIIDLTISDSEEISDGEEEEEENIKAEELDELSQRAKYPPMEGDTEDISAHGRKALLTPIATVLKLDRLGIGLKAKTEGPYKASVKRVTHSAASVAAHARAAEEARRRREIFGRGRRGYERQKRKEEERRRNLLAYMNT